MFDRMGINHSHNHLADDRGLAEALECLWAAGPDFVEICPWDLGAILGGRLFEDRARAVEEILHETIPRTRNESPLRSLLSARFDARIRSS